MDFDGAARKLRKLSLRINHEPDASTVGLAVSLSAKKLGLRAISYPRTMHFRLDLWVLRPLLAALFSRFRRNHGVQKRQSCARFFPGYASLQSFARETN